MGISPQRRSRRTRSNERPTNTLGIRVSQQPHVARQPLRPTSKQPGRKRRQRLCYGEGSKKNHPSRTTAHQAASPIGRQSHRLNATRSERQRSSRTMPKQPLARGHKRYLGKREEHPQQPRRASRLGVKATTSSARRREIEDGRVKAGGT